MSLVAWYPLNGNSKNYGAWGSTLQPTESSVVYIDSGKIGKAMHTGSLTLSQSQMESWIGNTVSIAMWIYVKNDGSFSVGTPFFGYGNMTAPYNRKFSMFHYPNKNDFHCSWQNDSSDETYWGCTYSNFFPTDTWTHICLVQDGKNNKVYVYKNGDLYSESNVSGLSSMNITKSYGAPLRNSINYQLTNDIRIYNHALSKKEVKEIYKTILVDFDFDTTTNNNIINDNSGYGNNATAVSMVNRGIGSNIGEKAAVFDGANSYLEFPSFKYSFLTSDFTIEFCINPAESGTRDVIFGDYGLGDYSKKEIAAFNIERNSGSYTDNRIRIYANSGGYDKSSTNCILPANTWTHVALVYSRSAKTMKIYKNGSLVDTITSIDITSDKLVGSSYKWRIGGDSRASNVRFNGKMSLFRIYGTALNDNSVLESYKTRIQVGRNGSLFTHKLNEDGIRKNVIFDHKMNSNSNSSSEAYIPYDNELYYEDDGSMWVRLFHHSNPSSSKFSTSDSFTTSVYKSADQWFNMSMCNNVNKWEIMVKQMATSMPAVPNSGTVNTVYFNTELTEPEIRKILDSLTYVNTPFLSIPIYPVLFSSDGTPVIFIGKSNHGTEYEITVATDITNQVYEYIYHTSENVFYKSNYSINKTVLSSYSGINVGNLNNLLTNIISTRQFNTPEKYRWVQSKNPMAATYGDVDAADVTYITTAKSQGRIPHIYQEVEYIENTGTQCINSEYAFKTDNTIIDADIRIVTNDGNQSLWGSEEYLSNGSRHFSAVPHGKSGSFGLYLGSHSPKSSGLSIPVGTRYKVNFTSSTNGTTNSFVFKRDTTTLASGTYSGSMNSRDSANLTSTTSTTVGHFFIFANHNSGNGSSNASTQTIKDMQVYSFKMYDDGVLVRDFIPCYRKSDSKVGLYDTVTRRFFTDWNGGNFTKGPDMTVSYTSTSYGGLYCMKNSNTYLAANNGTSGNWWGAVGASAAHAGGIPGWNGQAITTGYMDVYLRVDNVNLDISSLTDTNFKSYSHGEIYSPNIYEY